MRRRVAVTINGTGHEHEVEPRLLLVQYIRELAGHAVERIERKPLERI